MKRSGASFVNRIKKRVSTFFNDKKQDSRTSILAVDKKNIGDLVKKEILLEQEFLSKKQKIESEIIAIQKSTRVSIKALAPAHNYLRMKSKAYYNWHLNPYANALHSTILGIFLIGLTISAGSILNFNKQPVMASGNTYHVAAGGGTWNSTATWVEGVIPTSGDDVIADATSGNLTIDATAYCRTFNFTGYTGTLALGGSTLTANGENGVSVDAILGAGMTITVTSGGLRFNNVANSTVNLYTNGVAIPSYITTGYGNFAGQTFNLRDNLTSTGNLTHNYGTFNTNNFSVNIGTFSSANGNTRAINLGSSNITLTGTVVVWNMNTTSGSTLDAGTSTITATGANAKIYLNGKTLNNVIFTGGGTSGVSYGGIYNNLTFTGTAVKNDIFLISANQTINNTLTITGNSSLNRVIVISDALGAQRTLTVNGSVNTSNADFRDITGNGTASWNLADAVGGSGDCGGNTGITFTSAQANYWVGNGGDWADVNHWANITGGAAASGRIPLPQDDIRIDANSISLTGQTVKADTGASYMPRLGRNIDWSNVSNSPIFGIGSISRTIYGSLTLSPNMTVSGSNGTLLFEGRSNQTITSAGKTLQNITIQSAGGTYTLQDDLNSSNALTVNSGTFDANNRNLSVLTVNVANSNTRTVKMGSGTWAVTGTGATVWNASVITNLTFDAGTSTINLTNAAGGVPTFSGGGLTYYNLTTASSTNNSWTFSGNNTFNNFTDIVKNLRFAAGSTTTINGTFSALGTSDNVLSITSNTLGTPFTLTKASGYVQCDYINLTDSIATGGASWLAGANSIGATGQNNTGWQFISISAPTVTTQAATNNTTGQSFTANANVTANGGVDPSDRGVQWGTDASNGSCTSPANLATVSAGAGSTGAFTADITGLYGNNYYCYRGYATNIVGTTYSDTWVSVLTAAGTTRTISAAGGNWSATTTWIEGIVPTQNDDVITNAISGNVTIDTTANVKSFATSGYTGTINAGSQTINVAGDWSWNGGTLTAGTSTINMNATSIGKTFTSGVQTYNNLTFNGVGGGWTLQDALITGSMGILTLTAGSLNTNNQAVNIGRFSESNSAVRALTLGSSNITILDSSTGSILWNNQDSTNYTFNANTSTITLTGYDAIFYGGGKTYNNVVFTGNGKAGISQANAFTNLTKTSGSNGTLIFSSGQTITGTFTVTGNSTVNRPLVYSMNLGSALTIAAAAVNFTNVDFRDITFAGAMNINSATSIGDCGGNSGITFTPGQTNYWVGNGGNWSDANHWANVSGGAAASGRVPLPQDDVRFDASSFLTTGQTVTSDMPRLGKSIDWTGATNSPTWAKLSLINTAYGSVTLISNMTTSSNRQLVFEGRGNFALTSSGKIISYSLLVDMFGGKLTLNDSMTVSSTFAHGFGEFDANNKDVVVGGYSYTGSGAQTRTLRMGSGTWTLTGTGTPWQLLVNANLTFNAGTSTILFSDVSVSAKTFSGGGLTYNNISMTGGGAGAVILTGANTFNNFTINSPKTVTLTSGTTQAINGTFTANGASANLITLNSSIAGSAATISHAGAINTSWNSIKDITSTGGTWSAQFSTNVSNNNGIAFPSYKRVSNAGGNFSATTTWDGGVVPGNADDIYADNNSGNLTIDNTADVRSFDFTTYTNTLSLAFAGVTVWGPDNTVVNARFGSSMTITGPTTYGFGFRAGSTGGIINLYTNGLTIPKYININFTLSGTVNLQDDLTMSSSETLTIYNGTFNTNNHALNVGKFSSSNSNTRTINLGSSNITITGSNAAVWDNSGSNQTFNAGTSTITLTGVSAKMQPGDQTYNNVVFAGSGAKVLDGVSTYSNLTVTGADAKTESFQLNPSGSYNITGTLTLSGYSTTSRLLVFVATLGTSRTITAANVSISNADFRDIAGAGTANWDLSAISGGSGDCGGNTGITFTPGQTQYWVGNGGNWSDVNHWANVSNGSAASSRVPLPQDDVRFDANSFSTTGQTVTTDMPRIGKSIDWTGAINNPNWANSTFTAGTINYGSITMISNMTADWRYYTHTFEGRGNYTLTSAGKINQKNTTVAMIGGTLNLLDDFSCASLSINAGTFSANSSNLSTTSLTTSNSPVINMGSGNWALSGGGSYTLNIGGTPTINAETSTILLTYTGTTSPQRFYGGSKTYNNVVISGGGTGYVLVNGSNTFNNLIINGPKTVTFIAGSTQTVNGNFTANATSGNLITLNSSTPGSAATISHTGNISTQWNLIQDITSTGTGASWNASFSTNVSGNTGITFPSYKRVSNAGGNWSATTTWDGGVVPGQTDDIYADASSGNLIVDTGSGGKSIDFTGYTKTLTISANFTVAPGSGNSANCMFGPTMAIVTSGSGSIFFQAYSGQTIVFYSGGIVIPVNIITNNNSYNTGKILLGDDLNMSSNRGIAHSYGTFDTGNRNMNIGNFSSSNSATRTINLGSSNITITGTGTAWDFSGGSNMTLNAGASTLNFTGVNVTFIAGRKSYNNIVFTGGGNIQLGYIEGGTYQNFTVTGTNSKNDILTLQNVLDIAGTFTVNGNNSVNRILVTSHSLGRNWTITAANVSVSNADFRDITGAGTANWNLSAISGGSGDCGGNSGITFTPSQIQTWNGSTGNWSDNTKWTSRVPLPQDNVILAGPGTITADMPRLGKDISFVGNANLTLGNDVISYGSVNLTNAGTFSAVVKTWTFESQARSGTQYLTSASKVFGYTITIKPFGATLQLLDDLHVGTTDNRIIYFTHGTFDAGGHNVFAGTFDTSTGTGDQTVKMGSGTWTFPGSATPWKVTKGNVIAESSTIVFSDITSSTKTFNSAGYTYNNLSIASGGTVIIQGSNTFNNFTINAPKTVTFTSGTIQTIDGNFTANGTSGNLIILNSSIVGSAATISHAGAINTSWNSIQDITSTGGAWTAQYSTNVSGNTGITFPSYKRVSNVGGNFSDTTAWDGGVIPSSTDDIYADASSGNLTVDVTSSVRSFDFTGYTNNLALNGVLRVYGQGGIPVDAKLSSTMTITGISTLGLSYANNSVVNFYSTGITIPNISVGMTFSTMVLNMRDNLNVSGTFTVMLGTLNTNNFAMNIGKFSSSHSNIRTINLGSSNITITGTGAAWNMTTSTNLTFDAGTSSITFTGADALLYPGGKTLNNVTFNGGGGMGIVASNNTFANLTVTGTASKTDYFSIGTKRTITGTFTINGNSSTNRILLVGSTTLGSNIELAVNGSVVASNVDLRDITAAGTANWDLSAISGGSGDCGGNSGITFTPSQTQYFKAATGSAVVWASEANWVTTSGGATIGRVPLPQDDAIFDANSALYDGQALYADMPRLGRNIDCSSVSRNFVWRRNTSTTIYGSLTLAPGMSFTDNSSITFEGRGNHTITSAGKSFYTTTIQAVGGTYTLMGDFNNGTTTLSHLAGTFNANNYNVTGGRFSSTGNLTRDLYLGSGTWTETLDGTAWGISGSNYTINPGTSTISLTNTASTNKQFSGGNSTYYDLVIAPGGTGSIGIMGSNTFHKFACSGPKLLIFTASNTQTTEIFDVRGTNGNIVTIQSDISGTKTTFSKASGQVNLEWVSLKDIAAIGGATWYAGNNSTNVSGNSGWIFTKSPSNITLDTPQASGFTAHWDDTNSDETDYKVFVGNGVVDCSTAIYPGTANYTTAANAISQVVAGLNVNSAYCVKVTAVGPTGESLSAYSSTSKYTLANTPSISVAGNYNETKGYHLVGTISPNLNPEGTQYYTQYSADNINFYDPADMAWQAGTTYELIFDKDGKSLLPDTQYWLKVMAKNSEGIVTDYSASAADVTPPAAPTNLSTGLICSTHAIINWTAPLDAEKYIISYGTDDNATNLGVISDITSTSKDLTGLVDLTTYKVKVAATNANGTGAWSTPISVTTEVCELSSPTLSGNVKSTSEIDWSWSDTNTKHIGFYLQDQDNTNLSDALSKEVTSLDETNLSPNTAYTRHINVFNSDLSANSNSVTLYTLANIPESPVVSTISSSRLKITINPSNNPVNTRYAIYNETLKQYVRHSDHLAQNDPDWQLYSDWGEENGFIQFGLTKKTSYTYTVKAENGDRIATNLSPSVLATTKDAFQVTVNKTGAGNGSLDQDSQVIDEGEDFTATANADENSNFITWTGCDTAETNICKLTNIISAKTIAAQFEKKPTISLKVNDGGEFVNNKSVNLALTYSDNVKEYQLSEDSKFNGVEWQNIAPAISNFALSDGDGAKTLYIKVRDSYDGESVVNTAAITLDSTAPAIPSQVLMYDASDRSKNIYATIISWKSVVDQTSGLKGYIVKKNGQIVDNVNEMTANIFTNNSADTSYFFDQLNPATQASYSVAAVDNAGNQTTFNPALLAGTELTGLTGQKAGADKITLQETVIGEGKLLISDIKATPSEDVAEKTQATINWLSSVPSTSLVKYGQGEDYNLKTALDTGLNTSHTAVLKDLLPNTTYHYQVVSTDKYGTEVVSTDQTFTTNQKVDQKNAIEIILDNITDAFGKIYDRVKGVFTFSGNNLSILSGKVFAADSNSESRSITGLSVVNISTKDKPAYVIYWPKNGNVQIERSADGVNFVTVGQSSLGFYIDDTVISGNAYTYRVGKDIAALSDEMSGTPIISDIQIESGITTKANASVIITFKTDKLSKSQILYGQVPVYDQQTDQDNNLNQSHTVLIEKLKPNTTYHFKVNAEDKTGQHKQETTDQTFTTSTPPQDISVIEIIVQALERAFSSFGKWMNS